MPMYEFRCRECGARFEELRGLNEPDAGVECPKCGGGRVERLLSSFATSATSAASSPSGSSSGGSCGPRGFS